MRIVSVHFMLIPFRATLYAEMSARFQRKCREQAITLIPFPREMLCKFAAFPYHLLSIKSESDMLRLRQPSAKRHGGTPSRRMRQIRSLQNEPIRRRKTERVQIHFENCH